MVEILLDRNISLMKHQQIKFRDFLQNKMKRFLAYYRQSTRNMSVKKEKIKMKRTLSPVQRIVVLVLVALQILGPVPINIMDVFA